MKITDAALMNFFWAWEVMRRLGFAPRELFMTVVPPGGRVQETADHEPMTYRNPVLGLEVRRGDKTFRWVIGPTLIDLEAIDSEYDRAVAAWNDGTLEGVNDEAFFASLPFQHGLSVVTALYEKGMLPAMVPLQ